MSTSLFTVSLIVLLWCGSLGWAAGWEGTVTTSSDVQGVGDIQLTFGASPSALDGLDALDLPTPPPGQGFVLDAAFMMDDPDFPRFNKDIRPTADVSEWHLEIHSDTAGFTISWDVSEIPEGLLVSLEVGNRSVDMQHQDSLHLPQGNYIVVLSTIAYQAITASMVRSAHCYALTWARLKRAARY